MVDDKLRRSYLEAMEQHMDPRLAAHDLGLSQEAVEALTEDEGTLAELVKIVEGINFHLRSIVLDKARKGDLKAIDLWMTWFNPLTDDGEE